MHGLASIRAINANAAIRFREKEASKTAKESKLDRSKRVKKSLDAAASK